MFVHHILNCDENRLINQVFWAQVESPAKNDWVLQVKKDLKEIGLEYMSFENIKNMKKEQFRSLIKMKCKITSFEYLQKKKEPKSKMSKIKYHELNIQQYLISSDINL